MEYYCPCTTHRVTLTIWHIYSLPANVAAVYGLTFLECQFCSGACPPNVSWLLICSLALTAILHIVASSPSGHSPYLQYNQPGVSQQCVCVCVCVCGGLCHYTHCITYMLGGWHSLLSQWPNHSVTSKAIGFTCHNAKPFQRYTTCICNRLVHCMLSTANNKLN